MNHYYNSYFKVDTDTVVSNYQKVQTHIGNDTGIIPVIKGNCYGFGLVPMAKLFKDRCGARIIADSAMYEAVELRRNGIDCEILVLGGIPQHLLQGAIEYDLQIPLFEETTARRIEQLAEEKDTKVRVHIKIETGMNRLGVRPGKDLENLLNLVKSLEHIQVEGVYTHFACATADYYEPFTLLQFQRFQEGVRQVKQAGFSPRYIHCCNSAATSWFREAVEFSTHVRSCTSIMGHMAMEDGREPLGLTEPVEIGAYITNIHSIDKGESIGYGRAFTAEAPMRIATLSVGFADGFYPKWMRSQGPVLVNGRRTRFLGCCMDQSFIDVTDIPCTLGDRVILIGRDGNEQITTWEMEQFCGNTFEFLYGTLGTRVERIYK